MNNAPRHPHCCTKYAINLAKIEVPIPLPATAIPVAKDLYLSKYIETQTMACNKYEKCYHIFYIKKAYGIITGRYIRPSPIPTPNPIVTMSSSTLFAQTLTRKQIAVKMAPAIVTIRHPYLLTNADEIGPEI